MLRRGLGRREARGLLYLDVTCVKSTFTWDGDKIIIVFL